MKQLLKLHNRPSTPPTASVIRPSVHPGEVWLVGAGPGDAGLITVLGRDVLFQADVVFHDRLGCEEILQELPTSIKLVNVGKAPGNPTLSQEEMNDLLSQAALEGNRVVRLKGGDPFVFGRGMEEVLHLKKHGITTNVVPGLSSSVAGPSAAGVPLTHRTVSRGFSVQTGREEQGIIPEKSKAETRVYLMGMSAMKQIISTLIGEGFSKDTPATIVTNASTYREQIATGTLNNIVKHSQELGLRPPGILVIGETAGLAAEATRKETILVTSSKVPKLLEERHPNARFLWRPLVKSERLIDEERKAAQKILLENLHSDWVVFNSRPAVQEFFNLLLETGLDVRRVKGSLAAIGAETASALEEEGIIPDRVIVDGFSDRIATQLGQELTESTVLFPSSVDYKGKLAERLSGFGVKITLLPIYRFTDYTPASVDWAFVDAVSFASPRAVQRFIDVFPQAPIENLTALYIGDSTQNLLKTHGFGSIINLAGNDPAEDEHQDLLENHHGTESA